MESPVNSGGSGRVVVLLRVSVPILIFCSLREGLKVTVSLSGSSSGRFSSILESSAVDAQAFRIIMSFVTIK